MMPPQMYYDAPQIYYDDPQIYYDAPQILSRTKVAFDPPV